MLVESQVFAVCLIEFRHLLQKQEAIITLTVFAFVCLIVILELLNPCDLDQRSVCGRANLCLPMNASKNNGKPCKRRCTTITAFEMKAHEDSPMGPATLKEWLRWPDWGYTKLTSHNLPNGDANFGFR